MKSKGKINFDLSYVDFSSLGGWPLWTTLKKLFLGSLPLIAPIYRF